MTGHQHVDPPGPVNRYETIVSMLSRILREIDDLKTEVDDLDRTIRPFGDGVKIRRPRR